MKCTKCNFENPEDAVNCEQCGTKLSNHSDTDTNPNIPTETVVLEAGTRLYVDSLSFAPGEKFGERYQIIEEIGQGGMGSVFKAKDLELDIVVALKMIKPQLSSDPDIVSRFKRELLMAREVFHENVIRIHDLGEINGIKYISMNFIQGNTLKEIIQSTGKLTIEKSLDIIKQVCGALDAAHTKGIIHRDLKPQNIMLDKNGKAYVLDFGIARSMSMAPDAVGEGAGIVLGTPDFMAPEQIKGEKSDASTDIYSLGIILYEMVTGKLPFAADSPRVLLHKHLNEIPEPPSKLNPQVPMQLEKIILKCMEKKKKHRYQSVNDILQDIESDKTIELEPVKVKEKKERHPLKERKFFKYGLRIAFGLLIVYAIISALSLVNDSLYKGKIEKLQVEYETYYKNRFPLRKDWLPAGWETRECNAWDTYAELFPFPQTQPQASQTVQGEKEEKGEKEAWTTGFDNAVDGLENRDSGDLQPIIANYGKYFQVDRLFGAVKCLTLDSYPTGETTRMLYLPMVRRYAHMITLQARVDFLAGDYEAGLTKLYYFMAFSLDLFGASSRLAEQQTAMFCFNRVCRELIPLLLSRDIYFNPLFPYQAECLAAFGSFKPGLFPFSDDYNSPPERVIIELPTLHALENLIIAALKKLELQPILYREYLDLVKNYKDIYGSMGMKKKDYHIYGKLRFWNRWFSINRYFYKDGIELYRGMSEGMKYIRDMHDRGSFIDEYFKNNVPAGNILIADIPGAARLLNTARTFGKLVLIIHTINRYGMDSKEFLNLKGSDEFINELTGNKFEIIGEAYEPLIIVDESFKLDLKKIDYTRHHKEVLKAFKHFDQ
jgi:serine/threonine protein kinase